MSERIVTRTVEVAAPASEIFALVSDPHRHGELDGSGTVGDKVKGPHQLEQGAKFTVSMKQYGVPYKITSTVTAYESDRLLEWKHPMGHRWRWELEPAGENRTKVTETFDYSTSPGPVGKMLEVFKMPQQNAQGIGGTLEQLQQRFA